jgi:hypothetical protein
MNLVMVPMWLLSGVFFSSERFPSAVRPLIRALPLTAVNDGLRAIMLEGRPRRLSVELAVIVAGAWSPSGRAEDLPVAVTPPYDVGARARRTAARAPSPHASRQITLPCPAIPLSFVGRSRARRC